MELVLNSIISKAYAADMFGVIKSSIYNPYGNVDTDGAGLALLLGNALRIFFMVSGVLAFLNLTLAGFQYMMSGGDAKAMQSAWSRIYLSLVGLVLIVGSFALAAVFGYLLFADPLFMVRPKIFGPENPLP
jgi:hypothetical protein